MKHFRTTNSQSSFLNPDFFFETAFIRFLAPFILKIITFLKDCVCHFWKLFSFSSYSGFCAFSFLPTFFQFKGPDKIGIIMTLWIGLYKLENVNFGITQKPGNCPGDRSFKKEFSWICFQTCRETSK